MGGGTEVQGAISYPSVRCVEPRILHHLVLLIKNNVKEKIRSAYGMMKREDEWNDELKGKNRLTCVQGFKPAAILDLTKAIWAALRQRRLAEYESIIRGKGRRGEKQDELSQRGERKTERRRGVILSVDSRMCKARSTSLILYVSVYHYSNFMFYYFIYLHFQHICPEIGGVAINSKPNVASCSLSEPVWLYPILANIWNKNL